jgi:hypothetical protein
MFDPKKLGFPFRSISLHFISLHFTSLHFTSLHFTSFHFTSLHFTSLHFTSLHFTSLHFTSLHFTSLHFTSLQFVSFRFVAATTATAEDHRGWVGVCVAQPRISRLQCNAMPIHPFIPRGDDGTSCWKKARHGTQYSLLSISIDRAMS